MTRNKLGMMAAVIAAVGLGNLALPMGDLPLAQGGIDIVPWKKPPGSKGRSNNKWNARMKDRQRAKAAHKSRMAQKRKK